MAINYGKAYRDFKKELEKKHALYDQLGMSKEQIDALEKSIGRSLELIVCIRYIRSHSKSPRNLILTRIRILYTRSLATYFLSSSK